MPLGNSLYNQARLQGRLWTPKEVRTSLAFWFDAMDYTTLTIVSGGGVSQWNDKSGNARNATQATGANRPIYTPLAGLKNRPALVCTRATPTWIETASFNNPATFNYCGIGFSSASTLDVFCNHSAGSTAGVEYHQINPANKWNSFCFNSANGVEQCTAVSPAPVNKRITVFAFDATSTTTANFIDGTPLGTGARSGTNSVISAPVTLGAYFAHVNTSSLGGGLCEFLATTSYQSVALRQRFEGYMAWKWGTQDQLIGTHPYRKMPPLIGG